MKLLVVTNCKWLVVLWLYRLSSVITNHFPPVKIWSSPPRTHTHTHARTHTYTHARAHAIAKVRTHTHYHTLSLMRAYTHNHSLQHLTLTRCNKRFPNIANCNVLHTRTPLAHNMIKYVTICNMMQHSSPMANPHRTSSQSLVTSPPLLAERGVIRRIATNGTNRGRPGVIHSHYTCHHLSWSSRRNPALRYWK